MTTVTTEILTWVLIIVSLSASTSAIWYNIGHQQGRQYEYFRWRSAMKRIGVNVTWSDETVQLEDDNLAVQAQDPDYE